jgi:hypothetical protein
VNHNSSGRHVRDADLQETSIGTPPADAGLRISDVEAFSILDRLETMPVCR